MRRPLGVDERHIPLGKMATDVEVEDAVADHAATPHGGGSDGSPPASSPAPVVVGMPGALHVTWDPIVNADAVVYRAYLMVDLDALLTETGDVVLTEAGDELLMG